MSTNTKHTIIHKAFLQLVKLGIGTGRVFDFGFQDYNGWDKLKTLAEEQGLSAVVLDGIEVLRTNDNFNHNLNLPNKLFMLEWIGETLQGYEYRYDQYKQTIAEMAGFYNSHGYKMMLLKGYACSLDWPKPKHRPCGDIDIWQFGQQKEADDVLSKEKGVEIDYSHHHHTVFYWGDFMVENHYDFDNVHARKSNAKMEVLFKGLGQDDSCDFELYGERIYLPPPNLHALFLIRHAAAHFVGSNITIRQLLDWAFFAKKHTKEIDWNWLNSVLDEYHMKGIYNIINAICVEDLGFDSRIFHGVQFKPGLKEKVLFDIISPSYSDPEPKLLLPRLNYKFRRWKGNLWKQDLCFEENKWESFWTLLKSHLKKPEV